MVFLHSLVVLAALLLLAMLVTAVVSFWSPWRRLTLSQWSRRREKESTTLSIVTAAQKPSWASLIEEQQEGVAQRGLNAKLRTKRPKVHVTGAIDADKREDAVGAQFTLKMRNEF